MGRLLAWCREAALTSNAEYQPDVNLTPKFHLSVHTTLQSRLTLPSLNRAKVKLRGKAANKRAGMTSRAPPSDRSTIRHAIGTLPAPQNTSAVRHIHHRGLFLRLSAFSGRWLPATSMAAILAASD